MTTANQKARQDIAADLALGADLLKLRAVLRCNKKFSAGKSSGHPKKGKKVGTVFSFQLSEAASVKIVIELKGTGRKGPKGCAPQVRHPG